MRFRRNDRPEEPKKTKKWLGSGRKHAERNSIRNGRRKIIRRRRQKQALRLVAACLVIAALVVTVFSVKNYNSGSRHDNKGMNAYEVVTTIPQ